MLKAVLTLGLALLLVTIGFVENGDGQEKVVFKANTEFSIQLETEVNTTKNNVGDDVNFVLTADLSGEGFKLLKGTQVLGRIVNVEKLSAKTDTAKVCIMFDFVKNGDEYITLEAVILTIEPNPDTIKVAASTTFKGGTNLSVKSKEIQLDKGKVFHVKLLKDMTSSKTT
jgi:hypothetical protein